MTHCPYSLNLSPNAFLFPKIKYKMCREQFVSPETAIYVFRTLVSEAEK